MICWAGERGHGGFASGAHAGSPSLIYNVDMLDKAGLKLDDLSIWDKLVAAAKKLVVMKDGKPDVFGFSPETGAASIFQWMRAFGGGPWDADGKKVTVKSAESLAGFKAWARFFQEDTAPTPGGGTNINQLFAAGRLAMMQTGYSADPWLEPFNFRIEEARSVVDQLSGPIGTKQATVDDRTGEVEKRLQEVLDKPARNDQESKRMHLRRLREARRRWRRSRAVPA